MADRPRLSAPARRPLLVAPAVSIIGVFMLIPLVLMAYVSFLERGQYGGVVWGDFTAQAYVDVLFEEALDGSFGFNASYIQIFARSFWLSFSTMVIALAVGFPTALYMTLQPKRYRNLLIFLVTIPFWTNLLVRNYAWILLLRDTGLINETLISLDVISEPITLLYTDLSIAIGLTYSFLPFMVLPIYASLEKIDFRLVEAAYDLYATRWEVLRRVIVPLSIPGIVSGCILVFVPCLGSYVTPVLLGGGKSLMIGNLIALQFGSARNWPFGAALAFVLLSLVLLTMTIYLMRQRRREGAAT
ncbi:MAG: ABC transporter permease [Kiloniellales bacterium]